MRWEGNSPYFSSPKRQRAQFWFHFLRILGQEFWDTAGMEGLPNLGSKGRSKSRTPVVHFLFFFPKPKQDASSIPKTKLPSHIPVQNSPSFTILEVFHCIFWNFSSPYAEADLGWGSQQSHYLNTFIRIWTSTFFLMMKYFLNEISTGKWVSASPKNK